MTIERLKPGDPLSADRQNLLIDQVNRTARPGAPIETFVPAIQLFQLTGDLTYPETTTEAPYATAKRVWYHGGDDAYGYASSSNEQTIYHPRALRDALGNYLPMPIMASGEWVAASWNTQSGRWEIIAPAEDLLRFELKTALALGGIATAYLLEWTGAAYVVNLATEFTVVDYQGHFSGWARSAGYYSGASGIAVYRSDRGGWEIVDIQYIAREITFTLTQSMGATVAGQATATVNSYAKGFNPSLLSSPVIVYDPQGLFPRALVVGGYGAKGKAVLDDRLNRYHIVECQQMALMLLCTSSGAASSGFIPITSAATVVMQPITGQTPIGGPAASDPAVTGVYDTFSDDPPTGTLLVVAWNEANDRWECVRSGKQTVIEHGVVYTDYPSYEATYRREIEITLCDKAGENQTGDHFTAYTGIHPNFNTVLPAGTVVDFVRNAAGEPIIVSQHHVSLPVILYALAQSLWDDNSGDPLVSCKSCNRAGTPTGDAFDIYLPRNSETQAGGFDPSVYADDLITYRVDGDGVPICTSNYLWSFVGEIRMQNGSRIPTGWRECNAGGTTDIRGRVPIGYDPDGTNGEDVMGAAIGAAVHNHTAHAAHTHGNGNDPVKLEVIETEAGGGFVWDASGSGDPITTEVAAMTHSEEPNIQPSRVVRYIERYE